MSKKSTKTDLARIDRMTDNDIDYSDIPALDNSFFTGPPCSGRPRKSKSLSGLIRMCWIG